MHKIVKFTLTILTLFAVASVSAAGAPMEKRMALVIGNSAYQAGPLATPANDAGLIAQTLQAAGFDVVGARDLDEDSLRHAFRDFIDNASKAGPDTVAAVYFAGYALQDEGENYLVPVDANLAREFDVPVRTLRLSDYTRALAALHLKATMVVLDAARANPFSQSGQRLASGLALAEPDPDMLIAFNAGPGTIAPESPDGYGPYARALAEMIREGGLQPAEVFDRVRLRVNDMTKGAQVPWDASKIQAQFVFFERGPDVISLSRHRLNFLLWSRRRRPLEPSFFLCRSSCLFRSMSARRLTWRRRPIRSSSTTSTIRWSSTTRPMS